MQMLATAGIGPGLIGVPGKAWTKGMPGDENGGNPGVGLGIDKMRWGAAGAGTTVVSSVAGGMAGQAAAPTALPTTVANLYVRKTGSDNNGGSSNTTTPERTGSDGVTAGTTTFTAATGAFTSADVNKLINIVTKGRYRIVGFTNSTTVTLSGSPTAGSGLTWNLGGAVATIGALLTITNTPAGSVIGGDRIWIGAGTYRETITIGITPTSEIQVVGDTDGSMTGDSGMVQITGYTTSDKAAPSASVLLTLNGKSYLTFLNLFLVSGANDVVTAAAGSQYITFRNCAFLAGHNSARSTLNFTTTYLSPAFATFDRCLFMTSRGGGNNVNITGTRGGSVDYDMQIVISNSLFVNPGIGMAFQAGGAGAGLAGGLRVRSCTLITATLFVGSNCSTSIPMLVNNCFLYCGSNTAINAATAGQVIEDYNLISSSTPRANTQVGSHSISDGSYAPLFHFAQELQAGMALRQLGTPLAASPLLGFGVAADGFDFAGGPRPAGGGFGTPAAGMLERANSWGKETSTVRTGTNAISITGPGYQDFLVPVDATATTIAIYMRFDSNYSGPRPLMQILNGSECGVGNLTSNPVQAVDTWEQLSATFTPTSTGIVTVRLLSRDTSGAGKAFADDFSIA